MNPRPFYNVQAVSFQPETLNAVEAGIKSEVFDLTMRVPRGKMSGLILR